MSKFDYTLIALAFMFGIAVIISFWMPGANDKAFEIMAQVFTAIVSFILGKKTDSNA